MLEFLKEFFKDESNLSSMEPGHTLEIGLFGIIFLPYFFVFFLNGNNENIF